jgi:hypothetical protein
VIRVPEVIGTRCSRKVEVLRPQSIGHRWCLRAGDARPSHGAAEKCDELPSLHDGPLLCQEQKKLQAHLIEAGWTATDKRPPLTTSVITLFCGVVILTCG